jgi:hypothetical protein
MAFRTRIEREIIFAMQSEFAYVKKFLRLRQIEMTFLYYYY